MNNTDIIAWPNRFVKFIRPNPVRSTFPKPTSTATMEMSTMRTLKGNSLRAMMDPPFRAVDFSSASAVRTVRHLTMTMWTGPTDLLESLDGDEGAVTGAWSREYNERGGRLTPNPDTADVLSRQRQIVYFMMNHVFYDVINFLNEVGIRTHHLHLPCHRVMTLSFPDQEPFALPAGSQDYGDENTDKQKKLEIETHPATMTRTWEPSVLILPVYMAPGVKLRAIGKPADGEGEESTGEEELGVYNDLHEDQTKIWYFRAGARTLVVERVGEPDEAAGNGTGTSAGPAVVLVYGNLDEGIGCDKDGNPIWEVPGNDEDEDDDGAPVTDSQGPRDVGAEARSGEDKGLPKYQDDD